MSAHFGSSLPSHTRLWVQMAGESRYECSHRELAAIGGYHGKHLGKREDLEERGNVRALTLGVCCHCLTLPDDNLRHQA